MRKSFIFVVSVLLLFVIIYCLAIRRVGTTPKGADSGCFRRKSTGVTIYEDGKKVRDLSKSEIEVFVNMLEEYVWWKDAKDMKRDEKYNIMIDFNNLTDTKLYLSREIPNESFFDKEDVCYTVSDEIYNTVIHYIDN